MAGYVSLLKYTLVGREILSQFPCGIWHMHQCTMGLWDIKEYKREMSGDWVGCGVPAGRVTHSHYESHPANDSKTSQNEKINLDLGLDKPCQSMVYWRVMPSSGRRKLSHHFVLMSRRVLAKIVTAVIHLQHSRVESAYFLQ